MRRIASFILALAFCYRCSLPHDLCSAQTNEETSAPGTNYLTSDHFEIEGLPQQKYSLDTEFDNGQLTRLDFGGSIGYIITPRGVADAKSLSEKGFDPVRQGPRGQPPFRSGSEQSWVWIVPLWLALPSQHGDHLARFYVEELLKQGIHIVGFDVGTSLGSPKSAALFARFHDHVTQEYKLAPKARMLAVSNGGLITYGYAFRHPELVDRILAIYPALDFRSWPQFGLVVGSGAITPKGLAYDLTSEEMANRIEEFNPIDNLRPLAEVRIPLFHLHGDADELVPLDPNSKVTVSRYRKMGGDIRLKVLKGGGHGGTQFFTDQEALEFLTLPIGGGPMTR